MTHNHGGYPWRVSRCIHCQKMAVVYPHGKALCAECASDPNSEVYIVKSEEAKKKYLNIYNVDQWDAFCSRTFQFNGKNYEDFTWKEIAEAVEAELAHPGDDLRELHQMETQLRNGG